MGRVGIKAGWIVKVFMAFPVVPNGPLDTLKTRVLTIDTLAGWHGDYQGIGVDSGYVEAYVNEFNEICKTLRIGDRDEYN